VSASCTAVFLAVCALVLLPAGTASAHPLGNFTVNRYDGLVVAPGTLRVLHVEDLAEIPATQAESAIDKQGMDEWAEARCATAARDSEVTVGGQDVALTVGSGRAEQHQGQAGLRTLRVECRLTAPLPDRAASVRFHAAVDSGPGWREVTARGDRMTLTESDVPDTSVSRQLASYPEELLSSPEDTASASLRVRPGGPAFASEEDAAPGASILPRGADRWTRALDDLVARQDLTAGLAVLTLGMAVFLGAMHAMAPGHGKTIMAATAAARTSATFRDVLPMIVSVTVTHTLGVVALGLLIAAGSSAAPSVIAWLGIASGLLVMAAGLTLVRRSLLNRRLMRGHARGPGHAHAQARTRSETRALAHSRAPGHQHTHDHAHGHGHDGSRGYGHSHGPEQDHDHGHDHGHSPEHDRKHTLFGGSVTHTHGGFTHSHPVAPTLRGTILLGFAGGLVPSPSAVVVLVGAAALGKAWFGLALVLAFGVGLAFTLTAVGFAVVRAGAGMSRLLERRPRLVGGKAFALASRTVPLASAWLVVALGAGLVLRGAASALG
jgi:ABC-type nickel/cobalt efflux system permease component RcnA